MENYHTQDSLGRRCRTFFERDCLQSSPLSLNPALLQAVMPLHQIIRYANQAAKDHTPVYICVEEEAGPNRYQRTVVKGIFRSPVTTNRQIMFIPLDKDILHLLSIDSILSVQKAD